MSQHRLFYDLKDLAASDDNTPSLIIVGLNNGDELARTLITHSVWPGRFARNHVREMERFFGGTNYPKQPVALFRVPRASVDDVYSEIRRQFMSIRGAKRIYHVQFDYAVERVRHFVPNLVYPDVVITKVRISKSRLGRLHRSWLWRDWQGCFWAYRETRSSNFYVARLTPEAYTRMCKLYRA